MLLNKARFFINILMTFLICIISCKPSDQPPITNDISTTLELSASPPSPTNYNENSQVLLTATLTPQYLGASPTGLVTFNSDGKHICGDGVNLSQNNGLIQATCAISMPDIKGGKHTFSAQYMGETGYQASNMSTIDYIIEQYPTKIDSINITLSPNEFGSLLTLSATMQHEQNLPDYEGSVHFINQTTNKVLCDAQPLHNGDLYTFTCDKGITVLPSNFANGSNTISAQYLDEKYYANSEPKQQSITINKIQPKFQGLNGSLKATVQCVGSSAQSDCFAGSKIIVLGSIGFGVLDRENQSIFPTIQAAWNKENSFPCTWPSSSSLGSDNIHNFSCEYQTNSERDIGDMQCFIITYPGDISHIKNSSDSSGYACINLKKPGTGKVTFTIEAGDQEYTLGDKMTITGTMTRSSDKPLTTNNVKIYMYKTDDHTSYTVVNCTNTSTDFKCDYQTQSGDFKTYNHGFDIVYPSDSVYATSTKPLEKLTIKQIVPTITALVESTDPTNQPIREGETIQISGSVNLTQNFPMLTDQNSIYFFSKDSTNRISTCGSYTFKPDGTFSCTYTVTNNDLPATGVKIIPFFVQLVSSDNGNYATTNVIAVQTNKVNACPSQLPNIEQNSYVKVQQDGTVTLQNASDPQASGFSVKIVNVCPRTTCSDTSIQTTDNYGFVRKDETFRSTDTNPQYTCATSSAGPDGTIAFILSSSNPPDGFRPWADKFDIKVRSDRTFNVTVDNTAIKSFLLNRADPMLLDSGFPGCGLKGTVLQRVYDCSKAIKNYAVYINPTLDSHGSIPNPDGTSDFYTLFDLTKGANPDDFWFLAACPSGSGGRVSQQNCHWLTPVIKKDNPAFDVTTPGVPTFQFSMLKGYNNTQTRLLFGGRLNSYYTYSNANAFGWDKTAEFYLADPKNPGTTPNQPHPKSGEHPVCSATAGDVLFDNKTIFSQIDANVRDIISVNSGAKTIQWQMPSYPMLMVLAGGTSVLKNYQNGDEIIKACTEQSSERPYCNAFMNKPASGFLQQGFGAINVPGFIQSSGNIDIYGQTFFLLSSSTSHDSNGDGIWGYSPIFSGYDLRGGSVRSKWIQSPAGDVGLIRCVSLSWY